MLLIQRAKRYSPHSEEKDLAILEAVGRLLGKVDIVGEEALETFLQSHERVGESLSKAGVPTERRLVLSMGRAPQTLDSLSTLEEKGVCVLNPTAGVRACQRSNIERVMRENHLPLPPSEGEKGYWLKRGDQSAETQEDVCYCANRAELELAKERLQQRGIVDFIVQAHVEGDLIKFYGVEGTNFFRCFYPCDDGETKFGAEQRNGISHHFSYSKGQLQYDAEQLSRLLQTPIYGGDAIIRADGTYVIIDFNDWPSYSRCRQEAAQSIVERVRQL
ncbi:hypothetical protein [Prevotella veroralis]|uniref:hypothetical protein n=1 Tax=Prevotella veroralis TaxID=28137 RepID=UPI0003A36F78|nr:hypothetical protein [Prevotella veroralis]